MEPSKEVSRYMAEIGRRGGLARTSEERSLTTKKIWAKRKAGEGTAIAKKAWETKRAKKNEL